MRTVLFILQTPSFQIGCLSVVQKFSTSPEEDHRILTILTTTMYFNSQQFDPNSLESSIQARHQHITLLSIHVRMCYMQNHFVSHSFFGFIKASRMLFEFCWGTKIAWVLFRCEKAQSGNKTRGIFLVTKTNGKAQ